MRKFYIVEFENDNLNAVEEFAALKTAIEKCSLSIYGKYVIEEGFVVGRQLRSISDYLVHNFDNKYTSKKNYRLLRYTEIPKPDFENDRIELNDVSRFEIVSKIVDLLNSDDLESKAKIQRIQEIIE